MGTIELPLGSRLIAVYQLPLESKGDGGDEPPEEPPRKRLPLDWQSPFPDNPNTRYPHFPGNLLRKSEDTYSSGQRYSNIFSNLSKIFYKGYSGLGGEY